MDRLLVLRASWGEPFLRRRTGGGCLQGLHSGSGRSKRDLSGKVLANLLLIGLVEVITVPVFPCLCGCSILSCLPRLALIASWVRSGSRTVGPSSPPVER